MGNQCLYRKIKDVDLFAAEAHYHESCHRRFFRDFDNKKKTEKKDFTLQDMNKSAHKAAYNSVKQMLRTQLIDKEQVIQLSALREQYVIELDDGQGWVKTPQGHPH